MNITERIEQLRNERNWTMYRLAKEAGLSQATLSNLVNRGNEPSIHTLVRVANAFGITLAQFFDYNDGVIDINEDQKELIRTWRCLSISQKEKTKAYMKGMLDS